MGFSAIELAPGVNLEETPTLNKAGIVSSQFVRWREGIPEKRGGWAKFINAVFSGVPRHLHAWEDLNKTSRLAVGTTTNLYQVAGGSGQDITAQRATVSIAVNLTTTAGNSLVQVTDTGRNATVYNVVVFNTPVAIDGLVIFGAYQITQSGGANAYYITASGNAGSGVTGGGAVPLFTTVSGQATVTVTLAAHGYVAGEPFAVITPTTVGGVTLSGQYLITSVPTSSTFTIVAGNAATSSTSASQNGGNASLTYYVTVGPSIPGTGFGIGGFGAGAFGSGTPAPVGTVAEITATDYWLDNWGEILLSTPTGGGLFTWSPDSGYANCAIIPTAPLANAGMFVAMPQQQVVMWGSTYTGISDPLQIRWSDAGNYAQWAPTASNQAGGYRIPTGSQVVGGIQASQQLLFWTDIDLYAAQYVGAQYVWGFNKVAASCGLIAPKAVASLGTTVFWMSQKQFFMFGANGAVPLDCKVWDAVFQNLNAAYVWNIRGGGNSQFNEVSWDFPSAASVTGENDTRVTYNVKDGEWDVQPMNRSAWIDQSVLGAPIGASSAGVVYQHEISFDADGSPLTPSFTSGLLCIAESEDMVFVDWMMPDFKFKSYSGTASATIQISFDVYNYPGDTPTLYGPFTITSATQYIEPRLRGRYVQMTVASSDLGSFWRLGRVRYRGAPDGRV